MGNARTAGAAARLVDDATRCRLVLHGPASGLRLEGARVLPTHDGQQVGILVTCAFRSQLLLLQQRFPHGRLDALRAGGAAPQALQPARAGAGSVDGHHAVVALRLGALAVVLDALQLAGRVPSQRQVRIRESRFMDLPQAGCRCEAHGSLVVAAARLLRLRCGGKARVHGDAGSRQLRRARVVVMQRHVHVEVFSAAVAVVAVEVEALPDGAELVGVHLLLLLVSLRCVKRRHGCLLA